MKIAHSNDTTSKAAAESIAAHVPTLQEKVFDEIEGWGAYGATDDEIEVSLELTHQTASARRRELVKAGKVIDSGRTRKTRSGCQAIVWITTEGASLEDREAARAKRKRDKVKGQITRKLRAMSHDDLVSLLAYMEE